VLRLMMRCNTAVHCRVACGVHRGPVGAGGVVVGLCLVGSGFAPVVVPGLVGFEGFPGVTVMVPRVKAPGKPSTRWGWPGRVHGRGSWSGRLGRWRFGLGWVGGWFRSSAWSWGAGSLRLVVGTTVPSWPRQRRPHGPHPGDSPHRASGRAIRGSSRAVVAPTAGMAPVFRAQGNRSRGWFSGLVLRNITETVNSRAPRRFRCCCTAVSRGLSVPTTPKPKKTPNHARFGDLATTHPPHVTTPAPYPSAQPVSPGTETASAPTGRERSLGSGMPPVVAALGGGCLGGPGRARRGGYPGDSPPGGRAT